MKIWPRMRQIYAGWQFIVAPDDFHGISRHDVAPFSITFLTMMQSCAETMIIKLPKNYYWYANTHYLNDRTNVIREMGLCSVKLSQIYRSLHVNAHECAPTPPKSEPRQIHQATQTIMTNAHANQLRFVSCVKLVTAVALKWTPNVFKHARTSWIHQLQTFSSLNVIVHMCFGCNSCKTTRTRCRNWKWRKSFKIAKFWGNLQGDSRHMQWHNFELVVIFSTHTYLPIITVHLKCTFTLQLPCAAHLLNVAVPKSLLSMDVLSTIMKWLNIWWCDEWWNIDIWTRNRLNHFSSKVLIN